MDPLWGANLTDMMMINPWMFDPTQKSNQFSRFNDQPYAWPPTFAEGLAGGPVNSATGKPIQSYQDWKAQNPAGVTLNNTPAQAPPPPQQDPFGAMGAQLAGWQALSSPEQFQRGNTYGDPYLNLVAKAYQQGQGQSQPQAQSQPQSSGPPNNWQAALQAMAMPGDPVTQGANVPLSQSFQPAGGVNQAFLNAGSPSNFGGALAAIQGRRPPNLG